MNDLKIFNRHLPDDQYTSWQKVDEGDEKVKDARASKETDTRDDFNQFSIV